MKARKFQIHVSQSWKQHVPGVTKKEETQNHRKSTAHPPGVSTVYFDDNGYRVKLFHRHFDNTLPIDRRVQNV